MQVEVSTVINKPVATVWEFYAINHIKNHPRWDSTLELEATSDDPVGLGTVINRRATRFGKTTEGTMEVVEFAPEKAFRVRTQDGPMAINGWVLFEPVSSTETRISLGGEFPGMDDSMEANIRPMMELSAANIKALVESET